MTDTKNTILLNNVNFTITTTDKFFNDARKKESVSINKADSASYNTIIACLASVIKESYNRQVFMTDKEIRKFLINKVYCIDTTDSQKSDVYRKSQAVTYLYNTSKATLMQVIESATRQSDIDIITTAIKASENFTSQRALLKHLEKLKKQNKPESKATKPESAETTKEAESNSEDVEVVFNTKDITPEEASKALFMQAMMLLNKMDVNHRNTLLNEFSKVLIAKMESASKVA